MTGTIYESHRVCPSRSGGNRSKDPASGGMSSVSHHNRSVPFTKCVWLCARAQAAARDFFALRPLKTRSFNAFHYQSNLQYSPQPCAVPLTLPQYRYESNTCTAHSHTRIEPNMRTHKNAAKGHSRILSSAATTSLSEAARQVRSGRGAAGTTRTMQS